MPVLVYTFNNRGEACPCILHQEIVTGTGQAKAIGAVDEYVIEQDEVALSFKELKAKYPCRAVWEDK